MRTIFKLFVIICISFFVVSCDKHEKRETKYDNGQLHEQFSVLETKEGSFIKDGEYKTWFPSGQPESAGQYEEGKQMRNWKYWYSNGQMKSDYNLVSDTLDGAFIMWYENGQKMIEGTKKMSLETGLWTSWYDNGQMSSKLNYDQEGKSDGLQTKWHNNGQKASEENFLKGVKEGDFKFWNSEGKYFFYRNFKADKDTNLPALFKASNITLELFPDETYKITYFDGGWFSSNKWKTEKGNLVVDSDNLKLVGFNTYTLNKFKPDTINISTYRNNLIFIKDTVIK